MENWHVVKSQRTSGYFVSHVVRVLLFHPYVHRVLMSACSSRSLSCCYSYRTVTLNQKSAKLQGKEK